jgi:hypothetical protein
MTAPPPPPSPLASLSGALAGDDVSLSGGSASFAIKSAGTARTVTATGLTLSGAAAGNYQLASTSATALADITPRPLLVSATGANRVYDGTTAATVTLSDNRVSGDVLSTSYTGASFADKNAGAAKPIAVSGISVTGTDAANYAANTTATTTASITGRSLTVSATGADKVYDGTTSATVTLSDNRVAGDTLTASYTTASFASKNAGAAKSISVSGIAVSGVDSGNYTANTTASATANITAAPERNSYRSNKVYDGTTSATVTLADIAWPATASRPPTPPPVSPTRMSARQRPSASAASLSAALMRPTTRPIPLPAPPLTLLLER